MAQKTIVYLVDDLDNRQLDDSGQTITFGLDASQYDIDLSGDNAQKLRDALAPFIAAGRRTGRQPQGRRPTAVHPDPQQLQAVRQWGREHGLQVSERGRVAKEVLDAYRAAH